MSYQHYVYLASDPTTVIAWGNTVAGGGLGYIPSSSYLEASGAPPSGSTVQSLLPTVDPNSSTSSSSLTGVISTLMPSVSSLSSQ